MNDLEQIEAIIAKNLTITDQRLMDGVIGAVMDAVDAEREEKDKQIAFLKDSHDAMRELAYKTGVQEEREACAKVCEDMVKHGAVSEVQQRYNKAYADCVEAIRARESI
jgi:hypothetical protein